MLNFIKSGIVIDVDDTLDVEFSLSLVDLPFSINWDGSLDSVPILENLAPSFSGSGGLALSVSDGQFTTEQIIPVMVNNINTPAFVQTLDTLNLNEDESVSIMSMEAYNNGFISDIDNNFNELSFSLEMDSEEIGIDWDGQISTAPSLIPNPDVYGEFILYLCVNDGDNNTYSENIVVVNPINDSPFITVEEAIFNEGEDLTLASMEQRYNNGDLF